MGIFLDQCDEIRDLTLTRIDFGDDHTAISKAVKDGLARVKAFHVVYCTGIQLFVEKSPIPNLEVLYYDSERENAFDENDIIRAFTTSYPGLLNVRLQAKFHSSEALIKIANRCGALHIFEVNCKDGGGLELTRSDFEAFAPDRITTLKIRSRVMEEGATLELLKYNRLKTLRIAGRVDPAVLAAIGKKLDNLTLLNSGLDTVNVVASLCPNLRS